MYNKIVLKKGTKPYSLTKGCTWGNLRIQNCSHSNSLSATIAMTKYESSLQYRRSCVFFCNQVGIDYCGGFSFGVLLLGVASQGWTSLTKHQDSNSNYKGQPSNKGLPNIGTNDYSKDA